MNQPSRETDLLAGSRCRNASWALALVAAVFIAYTAVWHAGFIWDDDLHVTANPVMLDAHGLKEIWTSPAANYFPLTMTSFWVLHALCGLNPLPYHLVNVALHALSALLLWAVLRRLRIPGALIGAAWWALHPVQVESVAWISELKNTQSAVFFLLALWFYVRRLDREFDAAGAIRVPAHRSTDYALALAAGLGALLSKSSTVLLPVVLVLCAWWKVRPGRLRVFAELIPFFAVAIVVSGWTIWEQKYSAGAAGVEWSHSFAQRIAIAGRVPWFYLGKLLWPEPLSFIYPRWEIDPRNLVNHLPAAAVVVAAAWLGRRSAHAGWARAGCFALGAFGALLFPVLGFFDVYFFRFSFVGDHFQYLASMAAIAAAAGLLAQLPGRPRAAIGAGGAFALAALSWRQAHIYRSDLELFRATVAANPAAWMAHNNLSAALAEAGRADEAIAAAQRALTLRPVYAEAENNLGRALTLGGRAAEALPPLQRALQIQSDYPAAYTNLGIALAALNRDAESVAAFETAVRLKPGVALAQTNLGLALAKIGRAAEAEPHFATAARLQPEDPAAEMNWGLAFAASGRFAEAWPHLDRAVQLAPGWAGVHASYGRALAVAGRLDAAQAQLREALRLDPNSADAHRNLGLILQHLGRNEEAAEHLQAASRLGTRGK